MKKVFYLLFIISLTAILPVNVFAKKTNCITPNDIIKTIDSAERIKFLDFLEKQVQNPLPPQQFPLPEGFEQAEEIYFKQRISFKDPVQLKEMNVNKNYIIASAVKKEPAVRPIFFKLALDKTKKYVLLDLKTSQETPSNEINYFWDNFKGKYAYRFNFKLVQFGTTPYLFVTVETVVRSQENVPYIYVTFRETYPNIIFEGSAYEKEDYSGFSKKILKIQ